MGVVLYSAGTEKDNTLTNESQITIWKSPATMDSGDTVVLPTITGKTPIILSAFDQTDGDHITATRSSQTMTLDAAGSATDSVYVLTYTYI